MCYCIKPCVTILDTMILYCMLCRHARRQKQLPCNRQSRQILFKQMETISLSREQSSILHQLNSMKRETKCYPRWTRKYFHRNSTKDKSSRSQLTKSRVCQVLLYSVRRKACVPHMNNKGRNKICVFKKYTVSKQAIRYNCQKHYLNRIVIYFWNRAVK